MRLIDTTPFDIKFMDIPDGTEEYKQGYIDGARHVLEEMDEAPTVDAVPLDKLCEMFSYHHVNVPCDSDCENCIAFDGTGNTVNCWKLIISQWMEAQDAR